MRGRAKTDANMNASTEYSSGVLGVNNRMQFSCVSSGHEEPSDIDLGITIRAFCPSIKSSEELYHKQAMVTSIGRSAEIFYSVHVHILVSDINSATTRLSQ